MKTRSTPQLAATYDILAAAGDHPTARQVYERVRDVIPQVSLGTVYRNLEKLQQEGRARVVRLDGGIAHFDAKMEPHDHLVCEHCGAVADLSSAAGRADRAEIEARGFIVRWQTTVAYGACRACARDVAAARR